MKKTIILPILIFSLFLIPFVAQASLFGDIVSFLFGLGDPCLQLGIGAAYRLCKLVDRIAGALYVIGWGLAVVILLWGGIIYMTAGASEDKQKQAKKIITSGLIGAAIIVCSGFMLSLLIEFLTPLFY